MRNRFSLLLVAICACLGRAEEDYGQWKHSRKVLLDTAGLSLSGPVADFPLLVRLHAGNFDFSAAQPDGRDVRFSTENGLTALPYEIERWDTGSGQAELWVLADTVHADKPTAFRMYFGNDSAADSSNGGAVFAAANGFKAVWHMGNPSGNRPNSVSGGNPAVPSYAGQFWPGAIGGGDSLRGANGPPSDSSAGRDYLDIGDGYADFTDGFTYWMMGACAQILGRHRQYGTRGPGRTRFHRAASFRKT